MFDSLEDILSSSNLECVHAVGVLRTTVLSPHLGTTIISFRARMLLLKSASSGAICVAARAFRCSTLLPYRINEN